MSQTKKQSLLESITNITVGYCVALLAQVIVFPLYNMDVKISNNIQIGIIFTVVSLVRSYSLRRFFNRHPFATIRELDETKKQLLASVKAEQPQDKGD